MTIEQQIEFLVRENLNIEEFELINESYKHAGHAGDDGSGQTHFKLKVVSSDFDNLSRIDREKTVLSIVKPLFSKGLHAINIKAIPKYI